MKKRFSNVRSFLAGVLVAVLSIGLIGTAVASSVVRKDLYYNDIQIRLNGKTLIPEVAPFLMENTTYLPVRAVAEALGLNVGWDSETQTVILGNDPEFHQPAAWLGELDTFAGSATEKKVEREGEYDRYFTANNGDTFDRYYYPDYSSATYLLRGQYSRFTATLYLCQYIKNAHDLSRIQIFLDGELVYTSEAVGAGIEPIEISVPLNGAYKMEIVTQCANVRSDGVVEEWHNAEYNDSLVVLRYRGHLANAALWSD